jgi:hypothetical protein
MQYNLVDIIDISTEYSVSTFSAEPAARSFRTSHIHKAPWRHLLIDSNFHRHLNENFKTHKNILAQSYRHPLTSQPSYAVRVTFINAPKGHNDVLCRGQPHLHVSWQRSTDGRGSFACSMTPFSKCFVLHIIKLKENITQCFDATRDNSKHF